MYTVVCISLGTQVQKEKAKSLNKEQTTLSIGLGVVCFRVYLSTISDFFA